MHFTVHSMEEKDCIVHCVRIGKGGVGNKKKERKDIRSVLLTMDSILVNLSDLLKDFEVPGA